MKNNRVRRLRRFAVTGLVALAFVAHDLPDDVARRNFVHAEGRLDPQIGHAPFGDRRTTAWWSPRRRSPHDIGADILQKGGNAVDAAVATAFALAVTYPRAGNIGGGGFMVIHRADSQGGRESGGEDTTIDYRETAPAGINSKSFLDAQGNADPQKSRDSALAIGVPGTVAGLALAEEKYGSGKFTLADLIMPAIVLARDGIAIADDTADSLPIDKAAAGALAVVGTDLFQARRQRARAGRSAGAAGLADTLLAIAQQGPQAFYEGEIAKKIASAVQAAGGVMTADDLKNYRAIERPPVRGTYRGYDIVSMPPPSSGGVALIEMLNILEGYDLAHEQPAQALFLTVEAMKRAYADRAYFLGDPDAVKVPVARLTSKSYAAEWRATIDPERATPAKDIHPTAVPIRRKAATPRIFR